MERDRERMKILLHKKWNICEWELQYIVHAFMGMDIYSDHTPSFDHATLTSCLHGSDEGWRDERDNNKSNDEHSSQHP